MWAVLKIHCCVATAACALIASDAACVAQQNESLWSYEGSIVRLIPGERLHREMTLEKVGPPLAQAERGSTVFVGRRAGLTFSGLLTHFSKECGAHLSIPVAGSITKNEQTITLAGNAPQFNDQCELLGTSPQKFEFKYVARANPSEPDSSSEEPRPPIRAFLHDPISKRDIILTRTASGGKIVGTSFDRKGQITSVIVGLNNGPRSLQLTFDVPGSQKFSAEYRYLGDTIDLPVERDPTAPGFVSRWERVSGDPQAPQKLLECNKECSFFGFLDSSPSSDFLNLVSWRPNGSFTTYMEGEVCVGAPGRTAQQILDIFKQHRVPASLKYQDDSNGKELDNGYCQDDEILVTIPVGAERWAIENLVGKSAITVVRHSTGTAGGSGLRTVPLHPGTLVPVAWAPDTKAQWAESACKIRSTFVPKFRNVIVRSCSGLPLDQDVAQYCFEVILEGHTHDSGGFSSANLGRRLKDGYLVRSVVTLDAMQVRSPNSPSGYVERLIYGVQTTELARLRVDYPATKGTFRDVEHHRIGLTIPMLDESIASVVGQLVMASNFECSAKN